MVISNDEDRHCSIGYTLSLERRRDVWSTKQNKKKKQTNTYSYVHIRVVFYVKIFLEVHIDLRKQKIWTEANNIHELWYRSKIT